MPVTKTGMRGAVGIVDGPTHDHDFFPADALLELVSFLPHEEVMRLLVWMNKYNLDLTLESILGLKKTKACCNLRIDVYVHVKEVQ